jgi:hypoxanthine phosphoribosyltransferase
VKALVACLLGNGAKSVRVCAFLDKPSRREVDADVEFTGFALDGAPFVVGYGLDHAGRYRNLPFVGTLKTSMPKRAKARRRGPKAPSRPTSKPKSKK